MAAKGKHGTRRSITVRRVDTDGLTTLTRNILRLQYGDLGDPDGYYVGPLVAVRTTMGGDWDRRTYRDVAVICHEGVGWDTQEDGAGRIPIPTEWGAMGQPGPDVHISGHVLWTEYTSPSETIDLADWIRTFGDRLESNYSLWATRIGATPQDDNPEKVTA